MKRILTWLGIALMLLLLTPSTPAMAGGWIVVTVDALPQNIEAGVPVSIGFSVRQHGQTLVNLTPERPLIMATHLATGATIEARANQEGFTGHYRATVTFPSAGPWAWHIEPRPFPMNATMPNLQVAGVPGSAAAGADVNPFWQWWGWLQAWAEQVMAQEPATAAAVAEIQETTYGRDLFIAKGCASCHIHSAVTVDWNSQSGPDLTHYDKTAQYLELWLADPVQVKPDTEMPNLNLDEAEIAALAAFLTESQP